MSAGAQALNGVNDQFEDFNSLMRTLVSLEGYGGPLAAMPSTPQRKQKAMLRAQELETDLSDAQMVSLINLFQQEAGAADAYLVIQREALRKAWVQNKLY